MANNERFRELLSYAWAIKHRARVANINRDGT